MRRVLSVCLVLVATLTWFVAAASAATITGTVRAGSIPLQNAYVWVYTAGGGYVTTTPTNSSGIYTTPALQPGSYKLVTFNDQGYVDQLYPEVPCSAGFYSCSGPMAGTGMTITVAADSISNIDFTLSVGARVSGTVLSAVGNAPIPNATVTIVDGNRAMVAFGNTNANGVYTTPAVPPGGPYFLRTGNDVGFVDQVYNGQNCLMCDPPHMTGTTPVTLTVGTTDGFDFVLVPGAVASGTVFAADGTTPLSNVVVNAWDTATGRAVAGAGTDAFGAYKTSAFLPGSYVLTAKDNFNHLFVSQIYGGAWCASCSPLPSSAPHLNFDAGTQGGLNFSLSPGARIRGTVTNATTGASLGVNVNVYNAAGALVTTTSSGGAGGTFETSVLPAESYYVTTTNFAGLGDQLYNSIHNVPCTGCNVTTSGGSLITLTAGTDATNINFALVSSGARISGKVTNATTGASLGVNINVYNAAGTLVTTTSSGGAGGTFVTSVLPAESYYVTTTNFSGLVDQLYNSTRNVPCTGCNVTTSGGSLITLTAGTDATNINFALVASGAHISGAVTNATTGAPLSGNINVYNAAGALVTATSSWSGAAGTFYTALLPSGSYYITTTAFTGFRDQLYNGVPCGGCNVTISGGAPVTVTGGTDTIVNIALTPGQSSTITGIVNNAAGTPLQGVTVRVYSSDGTFAGSTTTSADGFYTTPVLNAGTGAYYVLVTSNNQGYADLAFGTWSSVPCPGGACSPASLGVSVWVTPTSQSFANVTLPLGISRITGTVSNAATGAGLSGVSVYVYTSNGAQVASLSTSASGGYATGLLPAVSFYVRTLNSSGFADEVYDRVPCKNCNVTTSGGTLVQLAIGADTIINFALSKPVNGTITGKVTDAADNPLSGVTVTVVPADGNMTAWTATTGPDGVYTTGVVTASLCKLRTSNSLGYIDQLYAPPNGVACPGGTCSITPGQTVQVVSTAQTTGVDFVLTPGARISGSVTSDGTGLPNVQVVVYSMSGTSLASLASAKSNASGQFVTPALPSGSYYLKTFSPTLLGTVDQLYDGVTCPSCNVRASGGSLISVTAGTDVPDINFALTAGGKISGTIRDASTMAAIAFARVSVFDAAGRFLTSGTSSSSLATLGVYTTGALPPGVYYVAYQGAISQPYAQQLGGNITCAECDVTQGMPIVVATTAGTSGVDLTLVHGGHVSGSVLDVTTSLPVSTYVNLFNSKGQRVAWAQSSAAGPFTTVAVPAGTYFARTSTVSPDPSSLSSSVSDAAKGYVPQLFDRLDCAGCTSTGTPIVVQVDATTPGVNFKLVKGTQISGNVTSLSSGVPNVTVRFYSSSGVLASTTTTDVNGHYTTNDGLPAGSYYARTFNASGYIDQVLGGTPCTPACTVTGGTAIVVPGAVDNVDFSLMSGGRISGVVTDALTNLPVSAVTVSIYDSTGVLATKALTNQLGEYTSGAGLLAGSYRVITSSSQGYVSQVFASVDCVGCDPVSAGSAVPVTLGNTNAGVSFSLNRGGRISGVVTDNHGQPIVGTSVEILASGFLRVATFATTGAAGQYLTLDSLPAGDYTVRTANALGYVNAEFGSPVTILGTSTTANVNFTLTPDIDSDGDGIFDTIDTAVMSSNNFSDGPLGGVTTGTIANRAGWTMTVSDISPDGVQAKITGAGSGAARLDVCAVGNAEQVLLDAADETAWITCQTSDGGTKVKAVLAAPFIQLQKTVGAITTVIDIATGQAATVGSPAIADANNTEPLVVRLFDTASGNQIGSFILPPGTGAEATATAGGGVQLTVTSGSVTGTIFGQDITVGTDQSSTVQPPHATPPTLTVPGAMTVEATGASGAFVDFFATATDEHGGNITPICTPVSGSLFPVGQTTVTCSATDNANRTTTTQSFSVTVRDTAPPVIGTTTSLSVEASSAAGAVVNYPLPTATDSIDGAVAVECSPATGSTFPLGTTTVTCQATDHAGYAATSSFTVTVVDTTAPVISGTPENISVTAAGSTTVTYALPTATDNIDGSVVVSCAPTSGSTFASGETTVTCTAKDVAGNAATPTSFTVTVTAPAGNAPVCSAATPSTSLLWPANHKLVTITINGVTGGTGAIAIKIAKIFQDEPTNTDDDADSVVDAFGVGTSRAQVRAERAGQGDGRVYHISFTATDSAGKSCAGEVKVGVPRDMSGHPGSLVDGGALYDSTTAGARRDDKDTCTDEKHDHSHEDGDACDHDRRKSGHKPGDNCDHEKAVKTQNKSGEKGEIVVDSRRRREHQS